MTTWRGDRLALRPFRPDDVDRYLAYRNDPVTLAMGGTAVAPTRDEALTMIDTMQRRARPTPGEWFKLAIDVDGTLAGDVSIHLDSRGGIAEIGYVVDPAFRGRGLAAEAAGLAVDRLATEHGVHRFEASLSPDNRASMRVLETIGMRYEALAEQAYYVDGVWEDDLRYAMTAAQRAAWVERPTAPPDLVELVELGVDARDWLGVQTHHSQRGLVSTVAQSFADAWAPGEHDGVAVIPWIRGVLADGERAGFVMVSLTDRATGGWYLWRLLVDRRHQRRGIGERAVASVVDEARRQSVPHLSVSYHDEPGGPAPFYAKLGFVPTGEIDEGETVARLDLTS